MFGFEDNLLSDNSLSLIIIGSDLHGREGGQQHSVHWYTPLSLSLPVSSVRSLSSAVNDACLVFDKRLVIDRDHLTNDPHILAAGPMTKFSRSYHSDQW